MQLLLSHSVISTASVCCPTDDNFQGTCWCPKRDPGARVQGWLCKVPVRRKCSTHPSVHSPSSLSNTIFSSQDFLENLLALPPPENLQVTSHVQLQEKDSQGLAIPSPQVLRGLWHFGSTTQPLLWQQRRFLPEGTVNALLPQSSYKGQCSAVASLISSLLLGNFLFTENSSRFGSAQASLTYTKGIKRYVTA